MPVKRKNLSIYRVFALSQNFAKEVKKKTKVDHEQLMFDFIKYLSQHIHDDIPRNTTTKTWMTLLTETK